MHAQVSFNGEATLASAEEMVPPETTGVVAIATLWVRCHSNAALV